MSKILVLDIETAPAKAYIWRMFDENIGIDQLVSPGRILCWGAKWFGQPKIFFADELGGRKSMMEQLVELLHEADAVVTYNGDKFDLPKVMGAIVEEGLPAMPSLTSIDVLKTVKKLGLQSNKLAFVGPHFKLGDKVDTGGFKLWRDIVESNCPKAWAKMRRYNIQDVRLLERLYRHLRPYIKNHPYIGTGDGARVCGNCGSKKIQKRGQRRTKAFFIERIHCQSCGAWGDGKRRKIT